MRYLNEIFLAVRHSVGALPFANKHKLWGYFWIPALLSLFLFVMLAVVYWKFSGFAATQLEQMVVANHEGSWFARNGKPIMRILILALLLLFYIKSYRICMSVFGSPFLGMLAEKVQIISCPGMKETPFAFGLFAANIFKGIVISLINLAIEISLTLFLVFLGLIFPVIAPVCTALTLMTEWYFIGFSMIDLRNEFLGEVFRKRYAIVWKHKFFAVGIGAINFLILLIPFLGVFFAPFISVIAAGRGIAEIDTSKKNAKRPDKKS